MSQKTNIKLKQISLVEIKLQISTQQKLLAIDMSKKFLGLALSDSNLYLAFPYKTIVRTNFIQDVKYLQEIILKENIFALIIGYPLNNEGDLNPRTQSVTDFIKDLQKKIPLACYLQDERFSTQVVKNKNIKNIKQQNDDQAAAWFLQIVLDKLKLT